MGQWTLNHLLRGKTRKEAKYYWFSTKRKNNLYDNTLNRQINFLLPEQQRFLYIWKRFFILILPAKYYFFNYFYRLTQHYNTHFFTDVFFDNLNCCNAKRMAIGGWKVTWTVLVVYFPGKQWRIYRKCQKFFTFSSYYSYKIQKH